MVIGQLLLLAKRNDHNPFELNLSVFKWLETGWLVSKGGFKFEAQRA